MRGRVGGAAARTARAACGSAPSTAWRTACCACTGRRPACRNPSRCWTPTTSCAWSSASPPRSNSTKAASRRARSRGGSTRRRTRAGGRSTSRSPAAISTPTMLRVYEEYEKRCQRAGLVDFAEILLRAHELLLEQPALLHHYQQRFGQILVDEFQDTNTIQYAFMRVLAGDTGQVFVVGDDDQAIYGWRGAKVENVQRFLRDYPGAKTFKLEQNYRSTGNILAAANAVIAHNPRAPRQAAVDRRRRRRADRPVSPPTTKSTRRASWSSASARTSTRAARRRLRAALPQQRPVARLRRTARPGAPALPRVRRPALLRAHGNQGRDGLPAPARQPRRRRRLRARGQHAAARHRRAHAGRGAALRARAVAVAVAGGARCSVPAAASWPAARAMRCKGFEDLVDDARGRDRRTCSCTSSSTTCSSAPACACTTPPNRRASWIRAWTTWTNWCRWPAASSAATTRSRTRT